MKKQITFGFLKDILPKASFYKHLKHCDGRCSYASPNCIHYCRKYDIGQVSSEELCKNDLEGKDILL